jgi:hypothetical protein
MKHLSNVKQKISHCCLDLVLYNKLRKVLGKSEALSLVQCLRFTIHVWQRTLRINLTSPNNFNAFKVYTTDKETNRNLGLIYHENFKQKTLVCNLGVCSADHRYVQTGENVHRVTSPGRLFSSVYGSRESSVLQKTCTGFKYITFSSRTISHPQP